MLLLLLLRKLRKIILSSEPTSFLNELEELISNTKILKVKFLVFEETNKKYQKQ